MGRIKVGVLGSLNIDVIIRGSAPRDPRKLGNWVGPSEIACLTAGSVGYFSQDLAKLGCEIHLVSTIADDAFGQSIMTSLKNAGISTDHIAIERGTVSGIGVYMLLFGALKRPMTYRLPTHHAWSPILNRDATEYLLDADLVHCGGYLHFPDLWNNDVPDLFAEARKSGLRTSLDPQFPLIAMDSAWVEVLKPILQSTDVFFLDENEALGTTGAKSFDEAVESLKHVGVKEVVIKLGDKGCVLLGDGEELHQPALKPARFVDSIGAGDSFDAGFLYGRLKGLKQVEAARLASYAASKSIEGPGGTSTFPTSQELDGINWEES